MNHSMITSSVSMHALQQKLDLLSNNIANVNTTGYKRREASFQDVLTNVNQRPQGFRKEGRLSPLGYNLGWGAKLVQEQVNMAQGSLQQTDNPLDLAIEGDGLFEVSVVSRDANNNLVPQSRWTRNGSFAISPSVDPQYPDSMMLTTKDGQFVLGTDNNPIRIPKNYSVKIGTDGDVMAYNDADKTAPPVPAGQLKLVRAIRPQLLQPLGDNLYGLPDNIMNNPQRLQEILQPVTAGNNADPVSVKQGFLEQSNVNLSDEMTELMTVQRAFQLNSRAITSSDQMMNLANTLRV
ncbi:flagellar hook-basal body protein [Paenibacillus sp. P25]|nr:flagellar hook-basal body protein [Paenibacillus sp. P25]